MKDLLEMNNNEKIEHIKYLMEHDKNYETKVFSLFTMNNPKAQELMNVIVENRRKEMKTFYELFKIKPEDNFEIDSIKEIIEDCNYQEIIEPILNFDRDDMNNNEIRKACKQVVEVLEFVSKEYIKMINISFYNKIVDISIGEPNQLNIVKGVKFNELELSAKAKQIISLINNKFWKSNTKIDGIFNNN